MCITNYLHYHHIPPCPRPIRYSYHYIFCASASYDPITSHPLAPCGSITSSSPGGNIDDPCTMSQCLVDQGCRSGACRLADLNGRYARIAARTILDKYKFKQPQSAGLLRVVPHGVRFRFNLP
ncbi:hypothetical protein DER45DRAFT_542188 [Fusarium avenaceum]|nr:hypothetical protein DER45DRAFT_542188 [Fusarium avenaceum]